MSVTSVWVTFKFNEENASVEKEDWIPFFTGKVFPNEESLQRRAALQVLQDQVQRGNVDIEGQSEIVVHTTLVDPFNNEPPFEVRQFTLSMG